MTIAGRALLVTLLAWGVLDLTRDALSMVANRGWDSGMRSPPIPGPAFPVTVAFVPPGVPPAGHGG